MIPDRYPDAEILAQRGHWDRATREVVLDRVTNIPEFRFFNDGERRTLEALCACVVPQDSRPPERCVAIAPWIDQRCHEALLDGFRFDDMPDERESWRAGLAGLDETAGELFQHAFADLTDDQRRTVLQAIDGGESPGDVWSRLPPRRWWRQFALRQIVAVYYSHPYAWNQIGFGGPAYPRGYASLNHGATEPWEPREVEGDGSGENREDWR